MPGEKVTHASVIPEADAPRPPPGHTGIGRGVPGAAGKKTTVQRAAAIMGPEGVKESRLWAGWSARRAILLDHGFEITGEAAQEVRHQPCLFRRETTQQFEVLIDGDLEDLVMHRAASRG